MLFIRSTAIVRGETILEGNRTPQKNDIYLREVRELAERVVCFEEDMSLAKEGRKTLMRLPVSPVPEHVQKLWDLAREKLVREHIFGTLSMNVNVNHRKIFYRPVLSRGSCQLTGLTYMGLRYSG